MSEFYIHYLLWLFLSFVFIYTTSYWEGVFQYSFQAVSLHSFKNKNVGSFIAFEFEKVNALQVDFAIALRLRFLTFLFKIWILVWEEQQW